MFSTFTDVIDSGSRPGAGRPARTPRGPAPVTYVIGAAGSGKSTLARRLVLEAEGAFISATRDWSDPDVARRALLDAAAGSNGTLAVDDAQHLIGTAAEPVLEAFVAASGLGRLIVVSRRPPTFAITRETVVTAPALALRLPDVAGLFRAVCHRRLDPETTSRVRHETAGWAQLVRELATTAGQGSDEALDAWLADAVYGDTAAGWIEEVLADLPSTLVDALTMTSALPQLDLARTAGLLGHQGAIALIGALDAGVVMHTRRDGGRRALPPMLRRHLLRSMDPLTRTVASKTACQVLLDEGATAEAADALAAGRAWTELDDLLRGDPAARRGAALWAEQPSRQALRRSPGIAAALEAASADDRITVTPPSAAGHAASAPLEHHPVLSDALDRIRRGDLAGAVPSLRRTARTAESVADRSTAQLALLVIRAPIAGQRETLDGLLALERQCVEHALGGLARITRGAIAAITTARERGTVAQVFDQLELRGDAIGAGIVIAVDVVDRFRRGVFETERATAFAERCDRLGLADVATWGRAMAAVGAAITDDRRAPDLIAAVDAATITLRLPGPRALLEAAAALRSTDADAAAAHAGIARRTALETGLPRLPMTLPRRARLRVETPQPTGVRVAVTCFGGFRLQLDGVEADLRLVRPQARMLLRMLALNAGAPLHRELIADLLWTDLGSESALHALHVSVSSLRRMLPASGRQGGIVERVGEAYRIGIAANHDCDLADFDEHLSEAAIAKARRDPGVARDRLVTALELYRGDVLPEDGPAEWAVGARERYRHRAGEAASSLAHLHSHFGETQAAVAVARRAVEIDPWLDDSWRTLVTMHDRAGNVIAARRAEEGYRTMRNALEAE
ncbi:BTAD domain-containing putative transcriptional regulator [Agromyces sp. PvR057]|uniref:BTAD domain-containing putative transcriptional regulator n=1 Tax=Agromyces sp. PvR057 TaxID=3156403 RepID=UPI003391F60E